MHTRYYTAPDTTYLGIPDQTSGHLPTHVGPEGDTVKSYMIRFALDYVGHKDGSVSSCAFGHNEHTARRFPTEDWVRVIGSACAEDMGYPSFTIEVSTEPPTREWWEL